MHRIALACLASLTLFAPTSAFADWTLNLGYQNPAGSTYGLNFLYMGAKWAFEAGIGWVDASTTVDDDDDDKDDDKDGDKDDDDSASLALGGDIDLKYLFSSGSIRPFLQAGFGVGIGGRVGDGSGASAGTGSGFGGAGLLVGSKSLYLYGSYNINGSDHSFVQAGLGFDI
jgi:hypothetical protein